MILPANIQLTLQRHQQLIDTALRSAVATITAQVNTPELASFYGQMQYHLGWMDADFVPTRNDPGKLLRPTLLLLSYEAAGAWEIPTNGTPASSYLQRALPAASAIELTHNFTLIHDDIEDGDTQRRHRTTLWKVWDVPQAINTGDGMYALSRLVLWGILDHGVEGTLATRLGALLDRTCLMIAEGQHLDINFEMHQDISVSMYLDMIQRKTGILMECATEMGALLGTRDQETVLRLRDFGRAIGRAFQVRDDILGVWASNAELGKTASGDIYRRKKSLPILHALEQASPDDRQYLQSVYQQTSPVTDEQVAHVLDIFEHTRTEQYCRAFLQQHCQHAREALAHIPHNTSPVSARALDDLATLVLFIEQATKSE
ncbi:MAG TPA: polyprenyl synthetase family protein [Ktedonobacteraceae bacterium]|nr:polyprenyl synthetase family protein [Ktedonobacteraceae bacterium]